MSSLIFNSENKLFTSKLNSGAVIIHTIITEQWI